jgi:hypothetical protein
VVIRQTQLSQPQQQGLIQAAAVVSKKHATTHYYYQGTHCHTAHPGQKAHKGRQVAWEGQAAKNNKQ